MYTYVCIYHLPNLKSHMIFLPTIYKLWFLWNNWITVPRGQLLSSIMIDLLNINNYFLVINSSVPYAFTIIIQTKWSEHSLPLCFLREMGILLFFPWDIFYLHFPFLVSRLYSLHQVYQIQLNISQTVSWILWYIFGR